MNCAHLRNYGNVLRPFRQPRKRLGRVGPFALDNDGAERAEDVIEILVAPHARRRHGVQQVCAGEQLDLDVAPLAVGQFDTANLSISLACARVSCFAEKSINFPPIVCVPLR